MHANFILLQAYIFKNVVSYIMQLNWMYIGLNFQSGIKIKLGFEYFNLIFRYRHRI